MHTHTNTLNHMSVIHSHVIKIWVIFHIAAHRKKKVNVITLTLSTMLLDH